MTVMQTNQLTFRLCINDGSLFINKPFIH